MIKIDRKWIGREFDVAEFKVSEKGILAFSRACGETDPRFTDPEHPDFQAPPTFTSKYASRRILPLPAMSSRKLRPIYPKSREPLLTSNPNKPGKMLSLL